jgi:hypothetical protein
VTVGDRDSDLFRDYSGAGSEARVSSGVSRHVFKGGGDPLEV